MRYRAFLLLLLTAASPLAAQSTDRIDRITSAWSDWMAETGTDTATLAILRNGDLVAKTADGISSDTALPIASLSKAITAGCVASLQTEGALSMDTPLREVLEDPGALGDVRIADLITHTSGISEDSTQNNAEVQKAKGGTIDMVSATAKARPPDPAGPFFYSNENYALLGQVIETVTGQPYAEVCTARLFDLHDLSSATLGGKWGQHASWGGWSISAADYGKLVSTLFGPDGLIGSDPESYPHSDIGGGIQSGMGILRLPAPTGDIYWSMGLLCWEGDGDGSYFASYGGEWIVVTLFSGCFTDGDAFRSLDQALYKAAME